MAPGSHPLAAHDPEAQRANAHMMLRAKGLNARRVHRVEVDRVLYERMDNTARQVELYHDEEKARWYLGTDSEGWDL